MGKRNRVTTRDIAEELGISQSTVSMILSNKANVSFTEETVQKVKRAWIQKTCTKRTGTGKISCKYNCRAMPNGNKWLLLDDDAVYH